MKLYVFWAVPLPIIRSTFSNGIGHTGLKMAFEQDQDGTSILVLFHAICEIGVSGWFYYKEICYDAWSHECKKQYKLLSL